ncbi:MAG: zf-HC2 domain-containing protein [Gammaproteobacteria bacterium]|nr:zf-HC2 domain-containing protein [Gammaproteobacteria bacterium]
MKLMFSCKDIHDRASQFIDGDCSMLTKAGVLMHILMCGNCRLFIKQLRLTVASIRQMPDKQHSDQDLDALADKILAKTKPAELEK